jgi:hypothetical protein
MGAKAAICYLEINLLRTTVAIRQGKRRCVGGWYDKIILTVNTCPGEQ